MRKEERFVYDVVWIDGVPYKHTVPRLDFVYVPETPLERFAINCKSFSDSVAKAFMNKGGEYYERSN